MLKPVLIRGNLARQGRVENAVRVLPNLRGELIQRHVPPPTRTHLTRRIHLIHTPFLVHLIHTPFLVRNTSEADETKAEGKSFEGCGLWSRVSLEAKQATPLFNKIRVLSLDLLRNCCEIYNATLQ